MASKSFGPTKNLAGKEFRDGALGEAIADLRADIETAFANLEGGDGSPKLHKVAGSIAVANPGTTASVVLTGSNFLLNGTVVKASKEFSDAGGDATITLTAQKGGKSGNDIAFVVTSDGDAATIDVTGTVITVKLQNGVTDTTAIKTLIDGSATAAALVTAEVTGGGHAWGDADVISETNLLSGEGDDISIVIGDPAGTACEVLQDGNANWTDTSISLADGDISIQGVDGDSINIWAVYGDSAFLLGTIACSS